MSAAASREIPMTKQVIDSLATLCEAKKKNYRHPGGVYLVTSST